MQPWDAFLLYNSLNLHFNTDGYDAIKYNFKTSARQKSFLARKDQFFFDKMAKLYPTKEKLIGFYVSNFVKHGKISTFGDFNKLIDTEKEWNRRMDSMSYTFGQELDKLVDYCERSGKKFDDLLVPNGNTVPVANLYTRGEISLETVVILNQLTNFMNHANEVVSETIFWPNFYRKVYKYNPFVRVDVKKFRAIVLSKFTH